MIRVKVGAVSFRTVIFLHRNFVDAVILLEILTHNRMAAEDTFESNLRRAAQKLFQDADTNKNGFLTKSEIRKYFKKHQPPPGFRLNEFFTNMDKNGDNQFDVIEFTNFALAAAAQQVFQNADKNKNGFLTKSELRKHFKKNPMDKKFILGSDFRWNEFFTNMDKDGDNKFDLDEFTNFVISSSRLTGTKEEDAAESNASETKMDVEQPDTVEETKAPEALKLDYSKQLEDNFVMVEQSVEILRASFSFVSLLISLG